MSKKKGSAYRDLNTNRVLVDFTNTNWKLLRKQKLSLVNLSMNPVVERRWSDLLGIIHMLDHIQDSAAEQLGDRKVFGK